MSFEAVLEQFRMNAHSPEDEAEMCRKLMSIRLPNLAVTRCCVRPSSVHGLGVFATRNIQQGELITLYPGDVVLTWQDDRRLTANVSVLFGPHIPEIEQDPVKVLTEEARAYEVLATETTSIIGNPGLCDDMAYVGHIINDGASCNSPESREQYNEETSRRLNAEHFSVTGWSGLRLPLHFGTRATRDIRANEEIFVSYSFGYWLTKAFGGNETAAAAAWKAAQSPKCTAQASVSGGGGFGKAGGFGSERRRRR